MRFLTTLATLLLFTAAVHAKSISLDGATVTVYFSPNGGAGAAAARLIDSAEHQVMLAGYSFTLPRLGCFVYF